MLPVVLHPDVVNFLRINTVNNRFQQQTWDCINQLRLQQFTGGLRVKKLIVINKRVWEARINLNSRLIFTYNKSELPNTGKIGVYIAVQDICDYDHLHQTVASVRTPDATWLDGEIIAEEYRLAISSNKILLKGSAGTGKTRVALYQMWHDFQQNPYNGKRLYVAYSALLVNHVKEQFYKLIGSHHPEIDQIFHFKPFRDLCLDILREAGETYLPEDEVDFQFFNQLYSRQSKVKRYPSALVWDQIRSIIKGQQLNLAVDHLDQQEYHF